MALEITWTSQADEGLQKVIDYLEQDWTIKEILKLEENINKVTNQIKFFPDLYPKSKTYKDLHKAIIDKNNYLVYKVNLLKNQIEIINFRGTKNV